MKKNINEYFSWTKKKDFSTAISAMDVIQSIAGRSLFWKKTAWVFNVANWKRPLIRKHLSEYTVRFVPLKDSVYAKERAITWSPSPVFVVWGMTQPTDLADFAAEHNIPIYRMEDGFFRSIGLGAEHVLPYSLCLDKTGLYYDSSRPSELETLIKDYDWNANPRLLSEACTILDSIRELGFSKYNEIRTEIAPYIYGPKIRRRILVIGQVEDDQSLLYGCARIMTNVELIKLAAAENVDAQIIYKPHPDVLAGRRKEISNPGEVAHLVEILRLSISLKDALYGVDRVYTLSSLGGFEALLHGVSVTTVGAPFYSGWGLTDDRQPTERRSVTRTLEQIFAAAYMLYPKYLDPETGKTMSLLEVIEIFKEKLTEIEVVTPDKSLEKLKPYNFATQHSVQSRFLYNSTAESIAIITDTPDALLVAKGFAARGKNVTFITTRDALANSETLLLSPEEQQKISVTSIHKRYSVALSETEAKSVELCKTFSDSLGMVLSEIASPHISADVVDALMLGLEDHIYFEALRFYGAKACLEEFDAVMLLIDDIETNVDIAKSCHYHGKTDGKFSKYSKIFLSLVNDQTKPFLTSLFVNNNPGFSESLEIAKLKSDFSSLWWSLQDTIYDDYSNLGHHVIVCGNVSNENYAYSPASLKLIEVIDQTSTSPILYFSSALMNAEGQNSVKNITLGENLSAKCTVYNGCLVRFRKKYSEEILAKAHLFDGPLYERFLELTRHRLPEEFIDIFKPRLKKYIAGLFTQVLFVAEVTRIMGKTILFTTSMDRSHISRIIAAVARSNGVKSIGIQPQIISTSTRYKVPAVDAMGVIDSSQVETYLQLGAPANSLHSVGSVNMLSRLRQIDECSALVPAVPEKKTLLFAMQHSNAFEMISTSLALLDICARNGYQLLVKPHPHQELPIVNEVRRIFGEASFARVLAKDSDTYEAAARCSIIVGLFSSVLLECALSGKDVVIAAFKDLNESIDFSCRGLALKALDAEQLEHQLSDLVADGPLSSSLRLSRAAYLETNPQFKRPYNTAHLDRFIVSAILSREVGLQKAPHLVRSNSSEKPALVVTSPNPFQLIYQKSI